MKKIIKMFKNGNVCVTGLRGNGKDVLFGNVIARRQQPYVSNLDYTNDENYYKLDFSLLDIGNNTYRNLIDNNINYYQYQYPLGSDIYISDVGVYLPSQYCNKLNNDFPYLATYQALSRQVSHNNVHINVQNLNRAWDKIREQSDTYIMCNWCKFLFKKLVIQKITIYDKYESCLQRCRPCRVHLPIFAPKDVKMSYQLYIDNFTNQHGNIKTRYLIYLNKSKHDTYYFEKLFKGGKKLGKETK